MINAKNLFSLCINTSFHLWKTALSKHIIYKTWILTLATKKLFSWDKNYAFLLFIHQSYLFYPSFKSHR